MCFFFSFCSPQENVTPPLDSNAEAGAEVVEVIQPY